MGRTRKVYLFPEVEEEKKLNLENSKIQSAVKKLLFSSQNHSIYSV